MHPHPVHARPGGGHPQVVEPHLQEVLLPGGWRPAAACRVLPAECWMLPAECWRPSGSCRPACTAPPLRARLLSLPHASVPPCFTPLSAGGVPRRVCVGHLHPGGDVGGARLDEAAHRGAGRHLPAAAPHLRLAGGWLCGAGRLCGAGGGRSAQGGGGAGCCMAAPRSRLALCAVLPADAPSTAAPPSVSADLPGGDGRLQEPAQRLAQRDPGPPALHRLDQGRRHAVPPRAAGGPLLLVWSASCRHVGQAGAGQRAARDLSC